MHNKRTLEASRTHIYIKGPTFCICSGPLSNPLGGPVHDHCIFKEIWTPQQCLLPSWKCGLVMCAGITSGVHLSVQNDLLLLEAVVLILSTLTHGHAYSLTSDSKQWNHILKSRHAHIFTCKNLCQVTRVYRYVWYSGNVHHWNYIHK